MKRNLQFTLAILLCILYDFKVKYNEVGISISPLIFESIENAYIQPENGRNVFLLETRNTTTDVILNPRQACAVESAALMNPDHEVFLIYASKDRLQNIERTQELHSILTYPNVHIYYINDLEKFTEGTPFEDFIKSRQLLDAKYPIEHTADVLRVLLLWKFGGTYTDTDTITRLPFDTLEPNFACQENEKYVVNGVWNMESADRSPLATLFAEHLTKNYDATTWAKNGPGLVTAVVSKLCGTESVTQMIAKKECEGFHVLPRKVCYPILYDEKSKLFNSSNADEIMTRSVNDICTAETEVMNDNCFLSFLIAAHQLKNT
ncbi:CLUMA_CG011232, isoform A [Clunio marinus]|uniref:CLUMA_CG011232, isoform A n=1 Tax=Clunio marinus TaxID=568069 RepID=A0A1J1IHD5_9DIPT|nr:CLUMA_CG011232, isoform A [Clunio marinus]